METLALQFEARFPRLLMILLLLGFASTSFAQNSVISPGKPKVNPKGVPPVQSSALNSTRIIDWSNTGIGQIPPRSAVCASLTASATLAQINSALTSCPSGQSVKLAAGTYTIPGTINVPSNVTLRGAGADQTILKATGTSSGAVIQMGSGGVNYSPINISVSPSKGDTSLTLATTSGVSAGTYLVVTEANDSTFVTPAGSEGTCSWCDGGWTKTATYARGQIVEVTSVAGQKVSITPALYSSYTHSPQVIPFTMAAKYAGVEDLQVYATNSGYAANFQMNRCAYCWVKGVESNYADGDHVEIYWGYRDEVRSSYFSNAFRHLPGTYDSDIQVALKTSATLIENNIVDRTHISVMLEWGAAGNVVAYNYTNGEFDNSSTNVVIGGINFHGAHPQFNLLEGNVITDIYEDSIWGSNSHTTSYRNWVVGTNHICTPYTGRATVSCSGSSGHYGFQAARAVQVAYLSHYDNFVGNVIGSTQMQNLPGYNYPLSQQAVINYPDVRSYDATAYLWSFGYGEASDSGEGTGCNGGTAPCHAAQIYSTDIFHGNVSNLSANITWVSGRTQILAPSYYHSTKPSWWGSLPWPATGPDVTGGAGPSGHSYGNPARNCYLNTMGGTDGGAGSPYTFNAKSCYGSSY